MYFRRTKKLQGEVSLNEAIETDGDGAELSIGDVVGKSDTMLEDLQDKDDRALVRRLVAERLTEREADIIRRRYGLEGRVPQTQRRLSYQPKLCLPHREEGAGKAGGGAAGILVSGTPHKKATHLGGFFMGLWGTLRALLYLLCTVIVPYFPLCCPQERRGGAFWPAGCSP